MLIGILSDTHGRIDRTQQAVRMLESLQVELLVHCGDVGSPSVLTLLDDWPVHFVLGNTDSAWQFRNDVLEPKWICHERFGQLELAGKRIAFLHGDDARRLHEVIHSGQWDLVCCGHTHAAEITTEGRTLVVNPGALHRAGCPSMAVVDLPALRATLISL
jgi:uncharacterized protein